MTARLISDEAAAAWMLSGWLRPVADDAATLILAEHLAPASAFAIVDSVAWLCVSRLRKHPGCDVSGVAWQALADAYRQHRAAHADTAKAIRAAVLVVLHDRGDRDAATLAAWRIAGQQEVMPPKFGPASPVMRWCWRRRTFAASNSEWHSARSSPCGNASWASW